MTLAPPLAAERFFAGPQPTLRGDGLVLRPWWASDAATIVRAYADPDIAFWHLRSISAAQAPGWIAERARRWSGRQGVDWAIVHADATEHPIGRMAIHRVSLDQGLGEVAYWIAPEARGARIAPRALRVLCDWAFVAQGMHRLELCHSIANPSSCRVAQRAGFGLEGVKRSELRHADGWHDMHLHARLAEDPTPGVG